jgi:pimeloyl-ACP methyl ester carboxylesterase
MPFSHRSLFLDRYTIFPFILMLVIAMVGCAPPWLGDTDAALAMEDIVAGNNASRLKAQTPLPSRRALEYKIDGRSYSGDVYLSPQGARAGIVLVPGVVPQGKDDSRLVALAYTLARLRFAVLVPDLQGLRRYRVRKGDVHEVADAFRYLVSQKDLVPEGRAGVAGISYSAGPVLLAVLEPDIREQVRFIVTLGGYYDMHTMVTYFTTGYYKEESAGNWHYRPPNPYAKWVFTLSNTDLLERPADRATLSAFAENGIAGDRDTGIAAPLAGLGPDARALYTLLTNDDPAQVPVLIDQLSPRIRNELKGINPAVHDLSGLRAQVILIHGRGDTIIPYTESVALARALPPEQVRLFLIDGFAHVDIQLMQQDIPQLLSAMELLLGQRADAEP